MIGKVIRPEAGQIDREDDRVYLRALFEYVNGLDGFEDGEPVHRTLRGYVVTYPETSMMLESNRHPEVRGQEDVVIRFQNQRAKEAFDRWREDGTWPEPVRQRREKQQGREKKKGKVPSESPSGKTSEPRPTSSQRDRGSETGRQDEDPDANKEGMGTQLDAFAPVEPKDAQGGNNQ
ncbi:hypothetical protein [Salinibacter altiplanensis]|uniref:hypothetical protein n=1 Tax=Salinibacter altiplanensis TaxID=1803181 RepID=UPI000C9EF680|nr:hypothetical protein [Salinibacter altiplanensis]